MIDIKPVFVYKHNIYNKNNFLPNKSYVTTRLVWFGVLGYYNALGRYSLEKDHPIVLVVEVHVLYTEE